MIISTRSLKNLLVRVYIISLENSDLKRLLNTYGLQIIVLSQYLYYVVLPAFLILVPALRNILVLQSENNGNLMQKDS